MGTVEASLLVPSCTTTAAPGAARSLAYCAAVSSETSNAIRRERRDRSEPRPRGAIPVWSPTSASVRPSALNRALANPASPVTAMNRATSARSEAVRWHGRWCQRRLAPPPLAPIPAAATPARPFARAPPFPLSQSEMRRNMSSAIATIGTTTITTKKLVRRAKAHADSGPVRRLPVSRPESASRPPPWVIDAAGDGAARARIRKPRGIRRRPGL
jgi:hypothetical protein